MLAERRDNDDELPGRPEAKEPGQSPLVHPLADSGGDWGPHVAGARLIGMPGEATCAELTFCVCICAFAHSGRDKVAQSASRRLRPLL